jgi:hypothetical protein
MANRGLVAFLDILGYQSLMENNNIEAVTDIIRSCMVGLDKKALGTTLKNLGIKDNSAHIPTIVPLLVSDSFLIFLPVEDETPFEKTQLDIVCFFEYLRELMQQSFKNGLPLRGAVDFGEFYLEGACYAGETIVRSHQLGSSLDFAGCVFTDGCKAKLVDLVNKNPTTIISLDFDAGWDYLCPCKDQKYQRLLLFEWASDLEVNGDVRQRVFEAFISHNKNIEIGVERKITNTEFTIRFLKHMMGSHRDRKGRAGVH